MISRKKRMLISITSVVVLLTVGFVSYNMFLQQAKFPDDWKSTGRVYVAHKGSMTMGINGSGIVHEPSDNQVMLSVKEQDIDKIKVGNKARVWIKDISSTLEGDVVNIADKSRIANKQAVVDVVISVNKGKNLSKGMIADGQIVLGSKQDALVIPSMAVQSYKDGSKFVWVLPAEWNAEMDTNVRPVRRNVKIGYIDERNAEAIDGLKEGEKVVVPAIQR
jgi:multidrug efflux pump subunit AcrA (membrane-fusion protein)